MGTIIQHADVLLVLACVFGFFMAWGIGTNDVANAMGTSVGSGALTISQAVVIAGIFEFLGAWLAGGEVTKTISSGLIRPEVFAAHPQILVLGMLASLLGAATFLAAASLRGLPVSTGQSIIGAILGFALVAFGTSPIEWGEIGKIALSWVLSPIIGGVLAFILFESIRRLILNHPDPAAGARRYLPAYVFLAATVIGLVTLVKGLSHIGLHIGPLTGVAGAVVLGLLAALVTVCLLRLTRYSPRTNGHNRYRNVERIFGYGQIFTAATMAFAHGSNDVANAVGPVAAVINVLQHPQQIGHSVPLPSWVLLLGGSGIVFGLATYGYRVMQTIGSKITALTPTRGFSAELAAAITVVLATWFGIPVSTTQTLVGAVLGVGLARGMRALNLNVLGGVFAGWLLTVPGAALVTAFYFVILRLVFG